MIEKEKRRLKALEHYLMNRYETTSEDLECLWAIGKLEEAEKEIADYRAAILKHVSPDEKIEPGCCSLHDVLVKYGENQND